VSPAGGEVGFGYFCHTGERHDFIIRFGAHEYWIRDGVGSMQGRGQMKIVGRGLSAVALARCPP
jgi:hypothetical protein